MSLHTRFLAAIVAAGTSLSLIAGCASQATLADVPTSPPPGAAAVTTSGEAAADATPTADMSTGTSPAAEGSTADAFPVTVTADNGDVTVAAKPVAIVSLSPTATEMLYAIGAGSQVVAVDLNANYPDDLPAERFDAYQLNVEALTAANPDLVISAYLSEDQLAQFAKLDIPVAWENAAATVDDTYRQIMDLGALTGHVTEATDVVARMKKDIATIVSNTPHFDPPATYYYELDDTYYSVTSSTFVGSVLGMLGITSIADKADGAAAAGGYPQLSAEFIVDANPDYVFLSNTKRGSVDAAVVAARPGWSTMDAVTGHRVIALDDDLAARWGPRIVDLLRSVADAVEAHPAQR